jgi:hypothetical protein
MTGGRKGLIVPLMSHEDESRTAHDGWEQHATRKARAIQSHFPTIQSPKVASGPWKQSRARVGTDPGLDQPKERWIL